jgi:2-pyrone-4,6-dicarboxylate lactonase
MPADAPKEALFAVHDFLGIERCVIVHTAAHGFDNTATADAVSARPGRYRGVALTPTTTSDAELKALDAAGFCGVRFHYMQHLTPGAPIDEVVAFGKRLAALGWHLQLHMQADRIAELAPAIHRAPVPVVIDHMGRIDASLGLDQPNFQALLRLLDDRNVWVKVSGCDRATRQGPPYADAMPFARKLVAEAGDRVVWGLDWPHPNHRGPIPDDGHLVDLIAEMAPSEDARQALLVDNPQRLYRFSTRE